MIRTIRRADCWRPECRAEWTRTGIRPVAFLVTGDVVARCHRRTYDRFSYTVERSKYAAREIA